MESLHELQEEESSGAETNAMMAKSSSPHGHEQGQGKASLSSSSSLGYIYEINIRLISETLDSSVILPPPANLVRAKAEVCRTSSEPVVASGSRRCPRKWTNAMTLVSPTGSCKEDDGAIPVFV